MNKISFFLLLLASFVVKPCLAQTVDQQNTAEISKSDAEMKQRGKEFRAALEQRFKELAPKNSPNQIHTPTVMDDVAIKYIPIGTSFEDAKAIMTNAGMDYHIEDGSMGGLSKPAPAQPYALRGFMFFNKGMFSNTSLAVTIYPKIPGNFKSKVGKVETNINVSSL